MPVSRSLVLLGATLFALGCSSAPPQASFASSAPAATTPPAQPTSVATASAAVPSASATAKPVATPGPAWQAVLDSVAADGTVSKDTALQAFSLAIGPLPGVTAPAGDAGFIPSGTMAVRWLASYWDQLTPDQQQAAIAILPELGGLSRSAADAVFASQNRTNDFYTQMAQQKFAEIGASLKVPIQVGMTIQARVGLPQKASSGAETGVYETGLADPKYKCLIVVAPAGDALGSPNIDAVMAHEVWHCYEGAIVGVQRYWSQNPAPWIMEGSAEWVAATLYPDAPIESNSWPTYLDTPAYPLFQRTYSAIGLYAQLAQAGADPWTTLVDVLKAPDNDSAFVASGATSDTFLDQWASGFLRDDSRGDSWQITGPAITGDRAVPGGIHLNNGGTVGDQVQPYTNEISIFQEKPDVLQAAISGHGRISDANGHDYLLQGGGDFCMLLTGCDCPNSTDPPPLPLEGDAVALAVSGGTDGAAGTLAGTSLDDFCNKGVSGTWTGTWTNSPDFGSPPATGGLTVTFTQKGSALTGVTKVSGPTCVTGGTATGTVSGGQIQFGFLPDPQRPVDFQGTITGNSMAGTWNAVACPPVSIPIYGTWELTKTSSSSTKP